jgi:hypothetical protein
LIKRLFDWTPRDIAYWENLRQKGITRFIIWYGMAASGGFFFVVFAIVTLINWLRQLGGVRFNHNQVVYLLMQLALVAIVSLVAGVINSLITWWVEDKLYRKYKRTS